MQSSSSGNILVRSLKIVIFGSNLPTKAGSHFGPSGKRKKTNCVEITKPDHKLSKTFSYKNIICVGWVMNLFLICVMLFFAIKGSFPAKTAVGTKFGPN